MCTPRVPRTLLALLLACLLVAAACSSDETDVAATTDPPPPATTETIDEATGDSVLTPGPATHLGLTWFSPPTPEARDAIYEYWDDASAAASVGRLMFDWIDVEPTEGEYRFDEVEAELESMVEDGLEPMLSIVAVDISGTDFPEWLDGFEPVSAAAAYLTMAEQLAPIMERHGVWLFAIANEPPLAEDDGLDREDFATFVELVTAGMDDIAPALPTTFTFAGGDPLIDDPAIDRLVAAGDALSVNHYCLAADLRVTAIDESLATIDRLVDRADGRPVVLQEFGCPAAASMGSSDEYQRDWFEAAFAHIAEEEQVRAAFVFEFLDWSQETFDLDFGAVIDEVAADVGDDFAVRFADWLLTSGLVRNDGTTRPAFDLFLETAPTMTEATS